MLNFKGLFGKSALFISILIVVFTLAPTNTAKAAETLLGNCSVADYSNAANVYGIEGSTFTFTGSCTPPAGTTRINLEANYDDAGTVRVNGSPVHSISDNSCLIKNYNVDITGRMTIGVPNNISVTTINSICAGTGGRATFSFYGTNSPAPTLTLTANPGTVNAGGSTNLSWSTTDATSCEASSFWSGPKSTSGNQFVGPINVESTYALTCTGPGGSISKVVTVYLNNTLPTVTLTANPTNVNAGQSSTLTWSSTNANSCVASGAWAGSKGTSGNEIQLNLTTSKTFTLTCTGPGGSNSATANVTVNSLPMSGTLTPATNTCIIQAGQNNCSISFNWNTVNPVATSSVTSLNGTEATGNSGSSSFSVPNGNKTFYLYNNSILLAQSTVSGSCASGTSWNGNSCQTGTTSGGVPSITTNSPTGVNITSATLNGFVNGNGLNTNSWFEWGTNYSSLIQSTSQNSYGTTSSSYNAYLSGLNGNTTYYYRAVAENSQGRVYGSVLSFTTSPDSNTNPNYGGYNNGSYPYYNGSQPSVATNSATNITDTNATINGFVNGNNLSTTAWFEWGTSASMGNSTTQNFYGYNFSNYNILLTGLTPNTVYYYRAVAQNVQGRVFGNIFSFVTAPNAYGASYQNNQYIQNNQYTYTNNLSTTTTPATNVYSTTAQLNGLIVNAGTTPSNTYFEWGPTASLGNKTETISTGAIASVRHANTITGLTPNTTYYFRIVADNGTQKSTGGTTYFITSGASTSSVGTIRSGSTISTNNVVRNTAVINTNTGNSSLSSLSLSIDGGGDTITTGERRGYHITWKNQSSQTLTKAVLRVILPASMTFESSTRGSFKREDNTLTLDIGNINTLESGDVFIVAIAKTNLNINELVVVVANLVYTNSQNIQEDAIAYATHHGYVMQNNQNINQYNLGASVITTGFLPSNLFGWLLLIILILLLILLVQHLFFPVAVAEDNHGHH